MKTRTATRLAALPLLAAGIAASLTGTASAATFGTHDLPVKAYSHGAYSVELTITNRTGQPLTLDAARTGNDCGHWHQAPQETLNDGDSETVIAYSYWIDGFDPVVTYDLPNGEYAYFHVSDEMATSNTVDEGVFHVFKVNEYNAPDFTTKDTSFTGTGSAGHGYHISAEAEIDQAS